jgi:hypothetical protein
MIDHFEGRMEIGKAVLRADERREAAWLSSKAEETALRQRADEAGQTFREAQKALTRFLNEKIERVQQSILEEVRETVAKHADLDPILDLEGMPMICAATGLAILEADKLYGDVLAAAVELRIPPIKGSDSSATDL